MPVDKPCVTEAWVGRYFSSLTSHNFARQGVLIDPRRCPTLRYDLAFRKSPTRDRPYVHGICRLASKFSTSVHTTPYRQHAFDQSNKLVDRLERQWRQGLRCYSAVRRADTVQKREHRYQRAPEDLHIPKHDEPILHHHRANTMRPAVVPMCQQHRRNCSSGRPSLGQHYTTANQVHTHNANNGVVGEESALRPGYGLAFCGVTFPRGIYAQRSFSEHTDPALPNPQGIHTDNPSPHYRVMLRLNLDVLL